MKHLGIADSHCHSFTTFATVEDGINSRVQVTLGVMDEAITLCKERGITSCIHFGDVFHSRVTNRYECFNPVFRKFQEFPLNGIGLRILRGNHDDVTRDGSVTTIDAFNFATIYKRPYWDDKFSYLPYTSDVEQMRADLAKMPSETILLAHIDVLGAEAGGWVSPKGLERSELTRFKRVLIGHFHKRQDLAPNVHYVGCVTPQDFTEKDQPGWFIIIDDETGECEWIQNSAPRFLEWRKETQGEMYDLAGAYVKILDEKSEDWETFMKYEGARAWIYAPERKVKTTLVRSQGISPEADLRSVVETYASIHAGSLNRDELVKIGHELLE